MPAGNEEVRELTASAMLRPGDPLEIKVSLSIEEIQQLPAVQISSTAGMVFGVAQGKDGPVISRITFVEESRGRPYIEFQPIDLAGVTPRERAHALARHHFERQRKASDDESISAKLQAMLTDQRVGGPELDRDLLAAVGWEEGSPGHWAHPNGSTWQDPRPSQALEEAKKLLRPAWVLVSLTCTFDLEEVPLSGPRVKYWEAAVSWFNPDGGFAGGCFGRGPTEALAVCDAALTASAISLRSQLD